MKKLSEMTKEELNSFVASAANIYKANCKEIDNGYEPYLSEEDAEVAQEWVDNGEKGPCPPITIKYKKKY